MNLNQLIVLVILSLSSIEAKQDIIIKSDKVENDTNKIQTLQSLNDTQKASERDRYFNKNINIKGMIQ